MQAFAFPHQLLAWSRVQPTKGLGMDCGSYKWMQNQTEVEVFVPIPKSVKRQEVMLWQLLAASLSVANMSIACILAEVRPLQEQCYVL